MINRCWLASALADRHGVCRLGLCTAIQGGVDVLARIIDGATVGSRGEHFIHLLCAGCHLVRRWRHLVRRLVRVDVEPVRIRGRCV